MLDLKVNKSTIKKRLEEELKYDHKFPGEFELIAKCFMYLGHREKSEFYFKSAIKIIQELIQSLKERNDTEFYVSRMLSYANYHRILNNREEMKNALKEIAPIYKTLCNELLRDNPDHYRRIFFEYCTVLFHLEDYEDAYKIGKFIRYGTVAPRGYAKGLLNNDRSIIEKTLAEVIKDIKDDKIQPFYNSLNIEDPWEWYEIGRQLLGLPSVLDMFKEDSK